MSNWRVIAAIAIVGVFTVGVAAQGRSGRRTPKRPASKSAHAATLKCGDLTGFQVRLARAGFSPGEIDGQTGPNLSHTLAAYQAAKNISVTSNPDCSTWQALLADSPQPTTVAYTISDADMKGPFTKRIPIEISRQAALPALDYRSPVEALAEKFHVSPTLLLRMNRRVAIAAGSVITVPAVAPFDPNARPLPQPDASPLVLQVSRDDSALRALREDGSIAFFAPVTTGSVHDPLPIGEWHVTSVDWHPVFHYNPNLFWDAKETDGRAAIKPGPNNPVGVVWIGLDKEHYGLHGTPEPGRIGHSESHGCVRLTNWDAARVASLVGKGSVVVFK
jgi:lipoprotein-anchoring transpeptidase ErfK/SrfK